MSLNLFNHLLESIKSSDFLFGVNARPVRGKVFFQNRTIVDDAVPVKHKRNSLDRIAIFEHIVTVLQILVHARS